MLFSYLFSFSCANVGRRHKRPALLLKECGAFVFDARRESAKREQSEFLVPDALRQTLLHIVVAHSTAATATCRSRLFLRLFDNQRFGGEDQRGN